MTTTYSRKDNDIFATDLNEDGSVKVDAYHIGEINEAGNLTMVIGHGRAHRKAVEKFLEDSGEVEGAPADIFPKPLVPGAPGLDPTGVTYFSGDFPPCPPENPEDGDKTPEVIRWWFKHKPDEAKAKYDGRRWDRSILD